MGYLLMKIVNVTPGLIEIPPNGWGAVEKIIWEQHTRLLELGHSSYITYLDNVPSDADIVHIHVANLAIMAYERGIPYYFTMHDHHSYLLGKDSSLYQENLLAIKHAVRAFVPAKYLVDYFEGIPEYISHGVNSTYFNPGKISLGGVIKYITKTVSNNSHKLLCVANNGYVRNMAEDRKGFGLAINVAKQLGLPITIAGPSNNKKYFEENTPTYNKLTILYDLSEEELRKTYNDHTIFLNPSELEAGHPNLTLLEAMACGLPVVSTFESSDAPKGIKVIERNETELLNGIKEVIQNYDYYSYLARKQAEELDWNVVVDKLLAYYTTPVTKDVSEWNNELINQYNTTVLLKKQPKAPTDIPIPTIKYNNVDGMVVNIEGGPDTTYKVTFIDKDLNREVYTTTLTKDSWAKSSVKYYVNWKVIVEDLNNSRIYEYDLDLEGKRVYIGLDSKSMGDTLAWFPYVEEFRKKHKCTIVCSTFWNSWFEKEYPEITFISPHDSLTGIFARYVLGLFYNENGVSYDMHPIDPTPYTLQKYATDILGLEYKEIKPRITQPVVTSKQKQVSIGIHSTAQTKYWNNPTGWQEVVDWLKSKGYSVRLLSSEPDGYMGNTHPSGVLHTPNPDINDTMAELKKSEFFIGIGSGLTWLSWTLNVPTVLISGFSDAITEMQQCIRISAPPRVCANCWNRHKFDRGDWNWCPDFKNTYRQFECTKNITGQMVIDVIKQNFNI